MAAGLPRGVEPLDAIDLRVPPLPAVQLHPGPERRTEVMPRHVVLGAQRNAGLIVGSLPEPSRSCMVRLHGPRAALQRDQAARLGAHELHELWVLACHWKKPGPGIPFSITARRPRPSHHHPAGLSLGRKVAGPTVTWSARQGLNPRPPRALHLGALPLSYARAWRRGRPSNQVTTLSRNTPRRKSFH